MADEYTPTIEDLRSAYADWESVPLGGDPERQREVWRARAAEFDRALAAHDAGVRDDERKQIARFLQKEATRRFSEYGFEDARGAAFWDAAVHIWEKLVKESPTASPLREEVARAQARSEALPEYARPTVTRGGGDRDE